MNQKTLVAVLTFGFCSAAAAQQVAMPNAMGPYGIGHNIIEFIDQSRSDRTLISDVWYPVDPADASGPHASYAPISTSDFAFPSNVAFEGVTVSAASEFPLLIFSHGGGAFSAQSSSLTETLASHGFVVVAPNHPGQTVGQLIVGGNALDLLRQRRLDVSTIIDAMEVKSASPSDAFFSRIDAERIGVFGHSSGAVTAFSSQFGVSRAGIDGDPRIDAVMAISPGFGMDFQTSDFGADVPTFLLGGTRDFTVSQRLFPDLEAEPRYLSIIEKADHGSYADICDRLDFAIQNEAPEVVLALYNALSDTCVDAAIPNQEAIDLTNLFAVSFFQTHVAGEPDYASFLSSDFVELNGLPVRFTAEGVPEPIALLPGDIDGDGSVQFADFLALANVFGDSCDGCPEDLNANGSVDFPDFLILSNNFGAIIAGVSSPVPEPSLSTPAFFAVASLVLIFRSREC